VKKESNIIQRDSCGKRKQVARIRLDKKPVRRLNSLSPNRKVMRRLIHPARAEGKRLVNSLFAPKKKVERLTNQKKRGGFSA
jgi:hypothetical protein